MALVEMVYKVVKQLPGEEKFALADQIRRCAISVPSNIAEGQKRLSRRETVHFSGIALASCAELETQLVLVQRIYGINTQQEVELVETVSKMLTALIRALRSKL